MKAFFVTDIERIFPDLDFNSGLYHHYMYHASCGRQGLPSWKSNISISARDPLHPLEIYRVGTVIPPMFVASTQLIVSTEVRNVLKAFDYVDFTPVVFKRLIDQPRPPLEGTYRQYGKGCEIDPLSDDFFLRAKPDVPEFRKHLKYYYQVHVPIVGDIAAEFDDLRTVSIEFARVWRRIPERLKVSESMLNKYPIVWWGCWVCREDLFTELNRWIDWNYFDVQSKHIR